MSPTGNRVIRELIVAEGERRVGIKKKLLLAIGVLGCAFYLYGLHHIVPTGGLYVFSVFIGSALMFASAVGWRRERVKNLPAGRCAAVVNFREARLEADLTGVDLRFADLRGTDLRQAKIAEANLVGAVYDEKTLFPENFDPATHGLKRHD